MERVRVGVIGCGMISEIYLKNITTCFSDKLQLTGVADINARSAKIRSEQFGVPVYDTEKLLCDGDTEVILNLTIPAAHYEITKKALMCGKSVYSEKPLAVADSEAAELLKLAEERELFLGCSPDTVLGGGIQKAKQLLESGIVGKPLSAQANCLSFGPELFHPRAEFLYEKGAGPLMDLGPYWITALVYLLGPVESVAAMGTGINSMREIKTGENAGKKFASQVPTHIQSLLSFKNGAVADFTVSFDTPFPYSDQKLPFIQINCEGGAIRVSDPNAFGGVTEVRKAGWQTDYDKYEPDGKYTDNSRGLGLAHMAAAMRGEGKNYACGEIAAHVLEVMNKIQTSIQDRTFCRIQSTCKKPGLAILN